MSLWPSIHREAQLDREGWDEDDYDELDEDNEPIPPPPPRERGPLGRRSSRRIAYAALDESRAPLSLGPMAETERARKSFSGVLRFLGPSKHLAILDGTLWQVDGMENGAWVNVSEARIVSLHTYAEVVDAWLRALVHAAEDPVRADATLRETTPDTFQEALLAWQDWSLTLAIATLEQLERSTIPRGTATDVPALFARARAGDRDASLVLEDEAWRIRDLTLYRFARATTEGKSAAARLYGARVRLR